MLILLLAACGGGGGGLPSGGGGGGGPVTTVTVTPAAVTVECNRVTQLVATDNNGNDITASVTWNSTDLVNAPVSATGLVTPPVGCTGAATVSATSGTIFGNSAVTLAAAASTFTIGGLTDPMAVQQWHLLNTGQNGYSDTAGTATHDIKADGVYSTSGISGTGVIVAVVDTGLEIAHEDLTANETGGSWDFVGNDTDPTNPDTGGDHGTAVAGLIAAARNTVGGIGVAPGATLKGFNFLLNQGGNNHVRSLGGSSANPNSRDVWIFNQSYGISTDRPVGASSNIVNQMASGTSTLRNGRGALYVKAAGNGFDDNGGAGNCTDANTLVISCENANFDPENTTPYNIVVGALNANGVKSSYSTTGSALWVSAPGGEYGGNATSVPGQTAEFYQPAMITTDQSDCTQGNAQTSDVTYVSSVFNGNTGGVGIASAANLDCNYTNGMNGTSSATPVTAGVIALMLEANPSLTWRDVKHILATTSTQVQPAIAAITAALSNGSYTVEPGWTTNAASPTGYLYHNWFGFGRVDASAAVAAALAYPYGSLGTFTNTGWRTSTFLSSGIPDNSTTGATAILAVSQNLVVEAVQIQVTVDHSHAGDLGIELTSPSGTRSVLKYIRDGFDQGRFTNFQMASNAFYGESGLGNWTLKVVDGRLTNTGSLSSWKIRVFGHAP